MKAIVYTEYGTPDVLRFVEVEKPSPKDNEVLIKIHAASLNAGDHYVVKGEPFIARLMSGGILKPKHTIPGADVAGRIEAVGKNVTRFRVGDAVFGDLSACGWGALAEYVAVPEQAVILKPERLTFEEAAAVPMAAVTALQGLRDKGRIRAGQKVLINGASGGVGTYAVQLAKAFGAEVTAVCSTRNVEMARSIGADEVIDYTQNDFTRNARQYDLIIAANGDHPLSDYKRALSLDGVYVCTGGSMRQIFQSMLQGPILSMRGKQKFGNLMAHSNVGDLAFVSELAENGQVKPVIDRCYPLPEAADAMRYLGEGHARGKVVITMEHHNA